MEINGKWAGLGLNDFSDEVLAIKNFMRRKFSYAKILSSTKLYDTVMVSVVIDMQRRYENEGKLKSGSYTPGVINLETKYVMGYLQRPNTDSRPMLFTVCGTGVPWWVGPDADVARALEWKYKWQPIGYRAAPFPMGTSIAEGRAELIAQIERWRVEIENTRKAIVLVGYSQGAIVTSECWEYDIKPSNGRLHWALPYVVKAVTFGNPMREAGKVHADKFGILPGRNSHGIADQLMVDTPDWWWNFAHQGDLYTDCEGQSGEDKTAIYKIVRGQRVFSGPDNILAQILEVLGVKQDASRIIEISAMFKAMLDAGMFFANKTTPHINYSIDEAIAYLGS